MPSEEAEQVQTSLEPVGFRKTGGGKVKIKKNCPSNLNDDPIK